MHTEVFGYGSVCFRFFYLAEVLDVLKKERAWTSEVKNNKKTHSSMVMMAQKLWFAFAARCRAHIHALKHSHIHAHE